MLVLAFLQQKGLRPDAQNRSRSTPLHSAARGGSAACLQRLLEWGAPKDARDIVRERLPGSAGASARAHAR